MWKQRYLTETAGGAGSAQELGLAAVTVRQYKADGAQCGGVMASLSTCSRSTMKRCMMGG